MHRGVKIIIAIGKFRIKSCYIKEKNHYFKNINAFNMYPLVFNLRFDASWYTLYEFLATDFISLSWC